MLIPISLEGGKSSLHNCCKNKTLFIEREKNENMNVLMYYLFHSLLFLQVALNMVGSPQIKLNMLHKN